MWLRNRGFTLIEMLIVVAILGILAAITYPSYQEYLRKGRRADARTVLLQAQQFIERSYTANLAGGYVDATDALPEGLRRAPLDGSKIYYRIGFMGGVTATSYMLSATPLDSQFSDTCGTLTLTNAGQKGADGKTDTATIDRCWR